jgi:hypothetical protein
MDCDGTRFAVIAETKNFLHYFSCLPDHRQAGKVDYPLAEILLLVLLAVLAKDRRSSRQGLPVPTTLLTECTPPDPLHGRLGILIV